MTIHAADQVSHEPPPGSFQATREDDSKYYVYAVSDKRKLNIKRKEFFQIADHT